MSEDKYINKVQPGGEASLLTFSASSTPIEGEKGKEIKKKESRNKTIKNEKKKRKQPSVRIACFQKKQIYTHDIPSISRQQWVLLKLPGTQDNPPGATFRHPGQSTRSAFIYRAPRKEVGWLSIGSYGPPKSFPAPPTVHLVQHSYARPSEKKWAGFL